MAELKPKVDLVADILGPAPKAESEESSDPLEVACEEWSAAAEAKDAKGMAAALRNAFRLLESEPHDEGGESPEE